MKVIQCDNQFQVLTGNSIFMHDELPAEVYIVKFAKMTGIFLETTETFAVTEKIYGKQTDKITKILNTFSNVDRNLGVLFSGTKGMGKSMSMRQLAKLAVEKGYPVLIINQNFDGIVEFLQKLNQSVIVLFDEFEKVFRMNNDDDSEGCTQDKLLSLFDGTLVSAKKLFIMSCNEEQKISRYMINRPGRIHYHIRFTNPGEEEIFEYCNDNIITGRKEMIPEIVELSYRTAISYDILRAVCFEINNSTTNDFMSIIEDLNINGGEYLNYLLTLKIGAMTFEGTAMFDFARGAKEATAWLWEVKTVSDTDAEEHERGRIGVTFSISDGRIDSSDKTIVISGEDIFIDPRCMNQEFRKTILQNTKSSRLSIKMIPQTFVTNSDYD